MVVGLLFTGIGIAVEAGHDHGHHLGTRLAGNLLIDSFFFFGIGLGSLFFLALQYATETGWYATVKRVIEAVAGYLPVGIILMTVTLLYITLADGAHLYLWMDAKKVAEDELMQGKSVYLNKGFFWVRTVVYFATYYIFWKGFRKRSLLEDAEGGTVIHFTNYKKGALFLVFFAVFSSTSAWDWIMSIDVHWFSTLFGWYVFASWFVSGLSALTLLVLFLKGRGYLEMVNENHVHDLGKFVFGFSVFWTYLFFSQFLLIYYANIPEESVYFVERLSSDVYGPFIFVNLGLNFFLPFLVLMTRDAKRHGVFLKLVCSLLLVGHWIDFTLMVQPGTLGHNGGIGLVEVGMFLVYGSAVALVVLGGLAKSNLIAKNHPMLEESYHHHI
ncbi:MAG: quinol:cytochrome C oxidoreductase [Chitinophagia bacterium]|nr:quinol:cytochrome C oxidoreductase [Chitinophagia bacterium]